MRNIIKQTVLVLLCGWGGLSACSTQAPSDTSADLSSSERALEWGPKDNPASLDDGFEYAFDALPMSGASTDTPWVGNYWPTYRDNINYRWEGEDTDSPATKYGKAFERTGLEDRVSAAFGIVNAKEKYGMKECSVDEDCNEDLVEVCAKRIGEEKGACIPTWWGICHAWAPAAIMEKEPKHAVTHNEVTFKINDIKALVSLSYTAGLSTDFISLRCDENDSEDEIKYDEFGIPEEEFKQCADTNAGTFHVIVTNMMGIDKTSFVVDRTFDAQVWNQPVRSYDVTSNKEVTAKEANELVGATEAGDTYVFNDKAVSWRQISMTFGWMTESAQDVDGNLSATADLYTKYDYYEYILELDADGKIIGGEWIGDSKKNHPDFIWYGTTKKNVEVARENFKKGTGISWTDVQMLLEKSQGDDAAEVTDGFVWTDSCDGGSGSFEKLIPSKATVDVGEIPAALDKVRIDLKSDKDVDVQLIDKETGHEIIAWPNGDLNGHTEACTTYHEVEYCYSGYNGDGTNYGHEWIDIKGVSNRPMLMKAYGYKSGDAKIDYSWKAIPDCVDSGSGTFTQEIPESDTVDVGVIPSGKQNVKVTLDCETDVDIQIYDGDTAIVMWPNGLLNGQSAQSVEYKGMTVSYSGYNGDGENYGYEYIMVKGEVSADLTMKAFGYKAGAAKVDYYWGLEDAEVTP